MSELTNAYQFKVTLQGLDNPKVWRRIIVPSFMSFQVLHELIQYTMGWENRHEFQFRESLTPKSKWVIEETPDEKLLINDIVLEARWERISARIRKPGKKFYYTYDLGDNWVHEIELEKSEKVDVRDAVLRCIDGEGACPPEDVCGVSGYLEMCRILKEQPDSESAKDYIKWLGLKKASSFKPAYFKVSEANKRLEKNFPTVFRSMIGL